MSTWGVLLRRSLGSHVRTILGLALVVGLIGGLSVAALAGARRTASGFTRYLEASEASDVAVGLFPEEGADTPPDYVAVTDRILADAAALPGVERTATHLGLTTMYLAGEDGRALPDTPEVIGSFDGRYTETDQVTVLEGRLADPDRADEVVVNSSAAQSDGLDVGAQRELVTIAGGDNVDDAAGAEVIDTDSVHVVGIVRFPEEVLRDEYDLDGLLLTTPALTQKYLEAGGFPYRFQALHLTEGTDTSTVINQYEELSGDAFGLIVRRTDEQQAAAQLALRPIVVALVAFGALTAAAALLLGALGVARAVAVADRDVRTLRAVGVTRGALVVSVAAPAVIGVVVGVALAMLVALLLSPLAPIGPIRAVEPALGFDVDAAALLLGTVGLGGFLLVAAIIAGFLDVRRQLRGASRVSRPSRVASALSALGVGPAGSVGVREGLGVGRAGGGVAWATLASWSLVVVAVVATLTFGASIGGLLDSPSRYGWAADRALVAGAGYITLPPESAAQLEGEPGIDGVSVVAYAPVELGDRSISAMGVDPAGGDEAATLLDGRLPERDDEVALAVGTARVLGVGIGDELPTATEDVTVVGLAALPAIGLAGVSHPSMAQGAVFTPAGVISRNGAAFNAVAFVDIEGADPAAITQRARASLADALHVSVDAVVSYEALLPAELVEIDPARSTAVTLVVVLAAAAALVLALALSSSVRRRRPQLATLTAIGFDGHDLRRSVRWQAAAVATTALVIGLPVGVVAGRILWSLFAWQVGVEPTAVIPVGLLTVVVVGVVLVAAVAGELPARKAARTEPGAALRPLA